MGSNQDEVAPTVRCGKRPRTVLPPRGIAALRRWIERNGLTGTLCTTEEWTEWRQRPASADPQQQDAYAWEELVVADILNGPEDYADERRARALLESLRARHLPHWPTIPLRILEDGADVGLHEDPAGAFRLGAEDMAPYVALWKLGDFAKWDIATVVHEFAHAMVYGTYGSQFQGVEPHGAEFVGALCYLLAEHYRIDVGDLLRSAVETGLRVLPFDPREHG